MVSAVGRRLLPVSGLGTLGRVQAPHADSVTSDTHSENVHQKRKCVHAWCDPQNLLRAILKTVVCARIAAISIGSGGARDAVIGSTPLL